jgi:hypothetical protein
MSAKRIRVILLSIFKKMRGFRGRFWKLLVDVMKFILENVKRINDNPDLFNKVAQLLKNVFDIAVILASSKPAAQTA